MPLAAGDDADRRRAGETVALDVPAGRGEHVVPRRCESSRVRPWAPVTKPARDAGREAEQLGEPPAATASAAAAAGEATTEKPFWSHAVATQSAATAAGSALPMTKPK